MAATCCSVAQPGESYFCSLNQAFICDPKIEEFDIIPCIHCQEEQNNEQEVPFIIVDHKLGIKSWCIKPLFLFAYEKLMRSHKEEKDCNLSVTATVQLSRAVLLVNAECYTAWNRRKEMISTGTLSAEYDMRFSALVLSKHPRSAETFAHRRWTIIQLEKQKGQSEFIQCCLRHELGVSLRAAESYADNYTAWSHRAWLVERFIHDKKKKLFCELQVMRLWAERHISDNCGFHYRQVLLTHLKRLCSKSELVHLLLSELDFTSDLIVTYPGHEVVWCHRRFVYHFWNQWFADVPSEKMFREISSSTFADNKSTSENVNRTSRRSSPSIIPSLFELASGSFKLLRELNSGLKSRTSVTEEFEDGTLSPLSTPSEVRFCNNVIADCTGSEGEVQERCASNYKQWIMLRSTPSQLDCNQGKPTTVTTSTGS
ncbi:protein prenyltransferase alpha subunit repeat-containing protein 1-like [Oculina patagonica]